MICVEIARVEDSPFEYRSPRPTALLRRSCSWVDDLADAPDKAHQLTSDSDSSDGRSLAATGHSMELAIEPAIAFFRDVDQRLRLILSSPSNGRPGMDGALVLPSCLHHDV